MRRSRTQNYLTRTRNHIRNPHSATKNEALQCFARSGWARLDSNQGPMDYESEKVYNYNRVIMPKTAFLKRYS